MHIIQSDKIHKCDNLKNHRSETYVGEESQDCQTNILKNNTNNKTINKNNIDINN